MIHQFAGCAQAQQRTARQSWIKGHSVRSAAAKKRLKRSSCFAVVAKQSIEQDSCSF